MTIAQIVEATEVEPPRLRLVVSLDKAVVIKHQFATRKKIEIAKMLGETDGY